MITPHPTINVTMPVNANSKHYGYYHQEKNLIDHFFNDTLK